MGILHPCTKQSALNRFPLKDAWDMLALAQLFMRGSVAANVSLTMQQKLACLQFYFDGSGVKRLFATPNRSGSRWSQLTVELAIDLQNGGDGEYVYENDHFYPTKGQLFSRLDWRTPSGLWVEQHARQSGRPVIDELIFLVTHNNFSQVRTRQAKNMKTVLITRSIPAIMASLYSKLADDKDSHGFNWDTALDRVINFHNSWGHAMTWHPAIRHYSYEALNAEPVRIHMEMLEFWDIPVSEENVSEALKRASKDQMLEHMPSKNKDSNPRISKRSREETNDILNNKIGFIMDRINRDLVYKFGYDYSGSLSDAILRN